MILANNAAPWLFQIETLIKELKNIFHVNAVRLRSLEFNYESEIFTPSVIHKLGKLNKVITVNPLRLEIETQFLVADELKPVHSRLVRLLNNKGVTVYNNTPLLGGINDTPEAICELSYGCRKAGIEFHHLYVAGLPVQEQWNQNHPITLDNIVDIAAGVRREGSGREIPRYIIRTVLGEVDFGLSSTVLGEGEKVLVKLLPYDLRYFKAMSTSFSWPAGIREDTDGKPVVPVSGLLKTTNFELS
jgi:L-lysine 2,3-aminomutase